MRRMKDKTKRIIAGAVAILIIIAMVLSTVMLFWVDIYAAETNGFTIEGKAGMSGFYKIGSLIPIEAVITNSSYGKDFTGEAEIKVNVSNDPNQEQYMIYSYPIELVSGASKKLEMNITIPTIARGIVISLSDKSGKSIASAGVPVTGLNEYMPLACVLTDDFNSLTYLKQFTFFNENSEEIAIGDRLLSYDEKSFPADAELLKNFQIIIINRFDTGRLSQAQAEAIHSFVSSGGLLIMGTGINAEQALSAFSPSLIDARQNGSLSEVTSICDNNYVYNTSDWESSNKTLKYVPLEVPGGQIYAYGYDKSSGLETAVSYMQSYGNGSVILHSFDLSESSVSESYSAIKLLNDLYLRHVSANSSRSYYYYGYSITNLLSNLPVFNDGTTFISFIIIGVYLLFIGPILYIILKKKDKRDLAWIAIPISAVVITITVYALSGNSIYSRPMMNTITVLDLPENSNMADATHSFSALSPKRGNVTASFDGNMPINMNHFMDNYYGYGYSSFFNNSSSGEILCKLKYGEKPSVTFNSGMSWSSNVFQANRSINLDGGLISDLSLMNDALTGTITNNTGYDLIDVSIVYGGTAQNLGPATDGEIIEVSIPITNNFMYGTSDPYTIASTLFDYSSAYVNGRYVYDREKNLKRDMISSELYSEQNTQTAVQSVSYSVSKSSVVTVQQSASSMAAPRSVQLYSNTELDKVKIYAFCTENMLGTDVEINGQTPTYVQTSLIKTSGHIKLVGSEIKLGYNQIQCYEVLSEYGVEYYGWQDIHVYGTSDVIFLYRLPDGYEALAFQFMLFNRNFTIYNNQTGLWDSMTEYEYTNVSGYFNENGDIQIKYLNATDEYMQIPSVSFTITQQ